MKAKKYSFRGRDEAQEKAFDKYMEENGLNQTQAMRQIIDIALNELRRA